MSTWRITEDSIDKLPELVAFDLDDATLILDSLRGSSDRLQDHILYVNVDINAKYWSMHET
jgi:hypothetical protein